MDLFDRNILPTTANHGILSAIERTKLSKQKSVEKGAGCLNVCLYHSSGTVNSLRVNIYILMWEPKYISVSYAFKSNIFSDNADNNI